MVGKANVRTIREKPYAKKCERKERVMLFRETDWPKLRDILKDIPGNNYNNSSSSSNNISKNLQQQCSLNINNNNKTVTDALIAIKDAIIGSNRQKGELIAHGLVPTILNLCAYSNNANKEDRMNALIILGSLAKGKEKQVLVLIQKYNVLPLLTREIFLEQYDNKCVEICLRTLRSIYEHQYVPVEKYFLDVKSLTYFLSLASAESSFKTQVCVTRILVAICKTAADQMRLLHAGTIPTLARMICCADEQVQYSALHCLSCIIYQNRSASDNVCVTSFQGRSMPDILTLCLSRMLPSAIQLSAARCLTYIYRSGTLMAADNRILYKTLPSLARLCSDAFDADTRNEAAETLAYLIEIDIELQRTGAISNSLLKSLYQLVKYHPYITRHAALSCYASLAANDEAIRKRIMDHYEGLINLVLEGLVDNDLSVRLASVRCLHSFSRSVQQLRTTFQDHSVWKPLMGMMSTQPTDELLIVITSTICNLLLEFSPSKEPLLNAGIIKHLSQLTEHKNAQLRLNSVWALMNMTFQADQRVRTDILNTLGTKRLLELLFDTDVTIVLKALGLLRNLLHQTIHVDFILTTHSDELFDALVRILDSQHPSDIKEQALCVIGNVAAEANSGDYIINNEKIMTHLGNYVFQKDHKLQAGAVFALNNIVHRKDFLTEKKYKKLHGIDMMKIVSKVRRKISRRKSSESYVQRTLTEIAHQMLKVYPELAISTSCGTETK